VITGATAGIGQGIARNLADTHHIVIGGRDAGRVARMAGELPSATGFVADLAAVGTQQFDEAIAELTGRLPRVDVLVHSAGVLHRGTVAETPVPAWTESFMVNVVAVAALTRALLPALRVSQGQVLVVNSSSGLRADPTYGAYCASKFGLTAFADALREEERSTGVRVTSLYPGRTDTAMQIANVAFDGDGYDPDFYLTVESVVRAARAAIDATPDASLESVVIRPARKRT